VHNEFPFTEYWWFWRLTLQNNPMLNEEQRQARIDRAYQLWTTGEAYLAGFAIFESIPCEHRLQWAIDLIQLVLPLIAPYAEFTDIVDLAQNDTRWEIGTGEVSMEAHAIVRSLRHPWGQYHNEASRESSICALVYNAGKVIYNLRQYPAPFDHDAAYRMAVYLRRVVEITDSPEFTLKAWATLCRSEWIQLLKLTACHPHIPLKEVAIDEYLSS
jgi:hypothetical protein